MKISKFIERLNYIKERIGDVEVVLSSDNEGNSYGSTNDDWSFYWEEEKQTNYVLVFPNYEAMTPEKCVEWEEKVFPRTHKLKGDK